MTCSRTETQHFQILNPFEINITARQFPKTKQLLNRSRTFLPDVLVDSGLLFTTHATKMILKHLWNELKVENSLDNDQITVCVCVCVGGDVEPFQYVAHASSAAFIDRGKINADLVRVVNETKLDKSFYSHSKAIRICSTRWDPSFLTWNLVWVILFRRSIYLWVRGQEINSQITCSAGWGLE